MYALKITNPKTNETAYLAKETRVNRYGQETSGKDYPTNSLRLAFGFDDLEQASDAARRFQAYLVTIIDIKRGLK